VEQSREWFEVSRRTPELYAVDYDALFVGAVRTALESVDPGLPFLDSSPSNGLHSVNPYVKRCPVVCSKVFEADGCLASTDVGLRGGI
jgi:hypothetical protein